MRLNEFQYTVWLTNMWNDDLLAEPVAKFKSLELAREFVEYQATVNCMNYVILRKD